MFQNLEIDLYFNDTFGPSAGITGGPTGTTKQTSATFNFNASTDPDATFECRLDPPGAATGSFVACGGPLDTSEAYTSSDLNADGAWTFSVRATDPSGNTGGAASRTWTIDTTPPETEIDTGPDGPTNDSTPHFTFHGVAGGAGTGYTCAIDAGTPSACDSGAFTAPSLSEGPHTFSVFATDAVGNADTSPATREFTIDTVAPTPRSPSSQRRSSRADAGRSDVSFAVPVERRWRLQMLP